MLLISCYVAHYSVKLKNLWHTFRLWKTKGITRLPVFNVIVTQGESAESVKARV